jgi:hypothetical protein
MHFIRSPAYKCVVWDNIFVGEEIHCCISKFSAKETKVEMLSLWNKQKCSFSSNAACGIFSFCKAAAHVLN